MENFPKKELQEIEKAGFEVLEYTKPWRFVRGTALKDGKKYFFKISPRQKDLKERLETQVSFDRFITKKLQEIETKPTFKVPETFLAHLSDNSTWFISEFQEGELLASWIPKRDSKNLSKKLTQVVETLEFFDTLNTNDINLLNDNPPASLNKLMLKAIRGWSNKPINQGLLTSEEFVKIYKLISDSVLQTRLQHGDFVPWHMIEVNSNSFCLIDGEAASIYKPRFYDLAYFYHRVFTKLWQPEISQKLLGQFLSQKMIKVDEFAGQFLPVLAHRTIGGIYDYTNSDFVADKNNKERLLHRKLLELILKKDLNSLVS